jgi:hypothetical protein
MKPRRRWTPEEIEALRTRYPKEGAQKLAREMGRTAGNVCVKASQLGIRCLRKPAMSPPSRYMPTPEEIYTRCALLRAGKLEE